MKHSQVKLPALSKFEVKSIWVYCPNSALDGWMLPVLMVECATYKVAHQIAKLGRSTYPGHLFAVLPMGWRPIVTAV